MIQPVPQQLNELLPQTAQGEGWVKVLLASFKSKSSCNACLICRVFCESWSRKAGLLWKVTNPEGSTIVEQDAGTSA